MFRAAIKRKFDELLNQRKGLILSAETQEHPNDAKEKHISTQYYA